MTSTVTTDDCYAREKDIRKYVDDKVSEIYKYIDSEICAQSEAFDKRIEKMEEKLDTFQWWLLGALLTMVGSLIAGLFVIVQIVSTP